MCSNMKTLRIIVSVSLLVVVIQAEAKFIRPDVEMVPTDRLIANLEKMVAENPKGVEPCYALARIHAIAYEQGKYPPNEYQVYRKSGLPFFGFRDAGLLPHQDSPKAPPGADTNHLAKALKYYTRAVELDPKHLASQIGLGWCQEQAYLKSAAIVTYRKALELGWAREQTGEFALGPRVTEEVSGYLLNLLDPRADAAEIKRVQEIRAAASKGMRAITPILIPLVDGAALKELVDNKAAVPFDLDGSGLLKKWSWPTAKAGWLVYDPDATGDIRSGLQMFGNVTFWVFWNNGYEALSALDNNADGWLCGEELEGLAIWCDANRNGISEPGEVRPLTAYGITALSCHYRIHPTGIPYHPAGLTLSNGRTRPTYDWVAKEKGGEQQN